MAWFFFPVLDPSDHKTDSTPKNEPGIHTVSCRHSGICIPRTTRYRMVGEQIPARDTRAQNGVQLGVSGRGPPVPALRCRHRGPDPSWRAPSALSHGSPRLRATQCPTGSDGTHHRLSSLVAPAPRPRTRVEAGNAATTATPVTSARRVTPAPNHDDPQRLSPTPPEPQLAQLVHISRRSGALAHPPAPATGASRLRRAPALALPGLPAATAIRLGSGAENGG